MCLHPFICIADCWLPLINGVNHSALFQFTPHGDKTLSQLADGLWSDTQAAASLIRLHSKPG